MAPTLAPIQTFADKALHAGFMPRANTPFTRSTSRYETYQNQMTPETYFEKVRDGHIKDPTITAQMRMGFEIRTLLKSYVADPQCGNCGILIVLDGDKDV
jgi:hypothetical protein